MGNKASAVAEAVDAVVKAIDKDAANWKEHLSSFNDAVPLWLEVRRDPGGRISLLVPCCTDCLVAPNHSPLQSSLLRRSISHPLPLKAEIKTAPMHEATGWLFWGDSNDVAGPGRSIALGLRCEKAANLDDRARVAPKRARSGDIGSQRLRLFVKQRELASCCRKPLCFRCG